MTTVRDFKTEARSAMPHGISAREHDDLQASFAQLRPLGQARVLKWLDREAAKIGGVDSVDLSLLRAFLAAPPMTSTTTAAPSTTRAPYMDAVRASGVDLTGTIDAAGMNRLLDAAGAGNTFDFVQTMILGDSGVTFQVGDAAMQAIAARLSPAERDAVAAQLPPDARAAFLSSPVDLGSAALTGAERLRDGGTARIHLRDADGDAVTLSARHGQLSGAEGLDRTKLRARLEELRAGAPETTAQILSDILTALNG